MIQVMLFDGIQAGLLYPPARSELVPPPRFKNATFESYLIDERISGLGEAVASIKAFALQSPSRWWHWQRRKPGLYIDGDFGVGKTHLLAAMFHANIGSVTFCSFAEAISLAILLTPAQAVERLAADLVCIDEFELDDPSNT
jgi:cell division protein ZapE